MNEFEDRIIQYWTNKFPNVWSFLGSPEEADRVPLQHKDQIHFLDEKGTKFISAFLKSSKMTKDIPHRPFNNYFGNVEQFKVTENCQTQIKKWLKNMGIPFAKCVFVCNDRSGGAVMLTWKMVIKYWEGLFFAEDLVIFDNSLEWGLFYSHNDEIYFGNEVIFNQNTEAQKTIELNELLKRIDNRNNVKRS